MRENALSKSGRNNINYDFMVETFAAILIKTNHADWALANLNREIAESPLYAPAWLARAELHFQQGEFAAAREDARMGLRLAPGDPQAHGKFCGGWRLRLAAKPPKASHLKFKTARLKAGAT